MYKMKKLLILLCTAVLVASIAGCLGFGSAESVFRKSVGLGLTKGVEITDFSSDPPFTYSGETIDVSFYAQNMGASEATNIKAMLYQLSSFKCVPKHPCAEISRGSLMPPISEHNIEGGFMSDSWSMKAPLVEAEQSRSILCSMTYDYSSSASTNIHLVGKKEWDSRGGASAFTSYSTSSQAPVTIKINPSPAIRMSEGQPVKMVPLDLSFENTGTGVIDNKKVTDFVILVKKGGDTLEYKNGAVTNTAANPNPWEITGAKVSCPLVQANDKAGDSGIVPILGIEQKVSMRCELTLPYEADYSGYIVEVSMKYQYSVHSNPLSIEVREAQ